MNFVHNFKKSLGQNFLIDQNIIKKIINIANIDSNKTILEIGPGSGNLTKKIIELGPKKVFAIEKDKKLSQLLKEKYKNYNNIEIINDDILKVIEKKELGNNIIIFGNLPYNISTQILANLMLVNKWPPWYEKLILMFQKEVAERILAEKNTKEFGRLSVLCSWRMDIKKHFDISKNCFLPKPKVNSTILSFNPKKNINFKLKDPKVLEKVTRILFSNRRKMINKNFLKMFKNDKLVADDLKINLKKRPEELSKENYYNIAIRYEKLFC